MMTMIKTNIYQTRYYSICFTCIINLFADSQPNEVLIVSSSCHFLKTDEKTEVLLLAKVIQLVSDRVWDLGPRV